MSLDLEQLITNVGYVGLFAIVCAESGLFFGFFLPGDNLFAHNPQMASKPTDGALASPRPANRHSSATGPVRQSMADCEADDSSIV